MCNCKGTCDFREVCYILGSDIDAAMVTLEDELDGPHGDDLIIPQDCPII